VVCWVVFCSELIGIIFPGFYFTLWEGGGLVRVRVSARDLSFWLVGGFVSQILLPTGW